MSSTAKVLNKLLVGIAGMLMVTESDLLGVVGSS